MYHISIIIVLENVLKVTTLMYKNTIRVVIAQKSFFYFENFIFIFV